ncbi:MAG TPA: DUF1553 domain-containing protein [Pirellulales bacterium]|nr:DUF1553 domain-containing protein [Pirellulales bacterium]
MNRYRAFAGTVCVALVALLAPAGRVRAEAPSQRLSYNRDIRPILSDKCFRCHGPDAAHRQADLRLDRREDAVSQKGACRAIVPGKPHESELYRRAASPEAEERMPPADSGLELSAEQIAVLKRWIEEGAEYEPHWAFVGPKRAPIPAGDDGWSRNPIDRFVLANLERLGIKPSAEATPEALIRRVTLDLTGLPPTPEETEAFVSSTDPGRYEALVDRLLASPRFGERLALDWLDLARYADTNGFYTDLTRNAWPWRDWVIAALNANLPFDRFTIEQLAGDLLPNATRDQRIATGFNRNHMVTNESGVIEEEYRVGYVVDRLDTTTTAWLGMTIGCARCHDHKYDPISQREYYELFACFNTVEEKGLVKDPLNPPPIVSLPTDDQSRRLAELAKQREQCAAMLKAGSRALNEGLERWESTLAASLDPTPTDGLAAYFAFNGNGDDSGSEAVRASTVGTLSFAAGVAGSAATFDSNQYIEFEGVNLDRNTAFTVATWIRPGTMPSTCVISKMAPSADARGFELTWYKSQPRINLVHAWGHNAIEIVARDAFGGGGTWKHVVITYDGRSKAEGVKLYVDGKEQAVDVRRDDLTGSIATEEPWRIAWKPSGVGFEGGLDELRLYDRPLAVAEVQAIYCYDLLAGAVAVPRAERSRQQKDALEKYYIEHEGTAEQRRLTAELASIRDQERAVRDAIPSSPIMAEMASPRTTHLLVRGQYDQPGEQVDPNVPAALGSWPGGAPRNRLGLAQWLVSAANPLTARVAVNRYWQLMFGDGLVRTPNDFGLQGELPTHPELLDWLAVDFVESGWNIKRLLKMIVTSSTYRQSSALTPKLLARDPDNRLLARGPRYRLAAEVIRDQALAASGLLVEQLGGPSVRPYQPAGIWEAVSYNGDQSYIQDHGTALYRRSLYTFWKRQAPPPMTLAFDGPTREICTVRRARTNTPLQALVLLNDVTYVEAARILATRMMRAHDALNDRIEYGFRRAAGRAPTADELAILERLHNRELAAYRTRAEASEKLVAAGEAPLDESLDHAELAALTIVASVILNLDEVVTQH